MASCTGIVWSTIWKVSLAVWPRISLRRCGSCRPGTWTRMRSAPCALDDRLGGAELVDAAADDLDRLRDGRADAVVDAGVGQRVAQHARFRLVERQFLRSRRRRTGRTTPAASATPARSWPLRVRSASRDAHLDRLAGAGEAGIADLGVAQHACGCRRASSRRRSSIRSCRVDRQQDVRAALQVEAERHRPLRKPARQWRPAAIAEDMFGHGEEHARGRTTAQIEIVFQREK